MKLSRLQVYDPPMCCSSGVCGPNVSPELVRFSSDLDWLRQQGVEVERYNLSSHPAEFARQEAVREALKNEGNDCLPLIVVDGSIVSTGIYPKRSDLMKLSGMETTGIAASTSESIEETAACGPGCSCGTPSGSRRLKSMVSLIVLLAVGGIFIYKAWSARQNASNNIAAKGEATFAVAQTAPNAVPGVETKSSSVEGSTGAGLKIGESLESLSALNKVAMEQDGAFIFIPDPKSELADSKMNDALLAAQKTLKSNKISLGLYTLSAKSADYSGISQQTKPPAILVAVKGKGMSAVTGEVTETKLLQAFTASSRSGGCGAGGCGPSGGCN